ncbi:MAG: hypothetical protein NTW19_15085 [Planctomycetota bacterium]|nr:hypothetical protein [Planctomycetota bacterium]
MAFVNCRANAGSQHTATRFGCIFFASLLFTSFLTHPALAASGPAGSQPANRELVAELIGELNEPYPVGAAARDKLAAMGAAAAPALREAARHHSDPITRVRARAAWEKALPLKADSEPPHRVAGREAMAKHRFEEAIAEFLPLTLGAWAYPKDSMALAEAYEKAGRWGEARDAYVAVAERIDEVVSLPIAAMTRPVKRPEGKEENRGRALVGGDPFGGGDQWDGDLIEVLLDGRWTSAKPGGWDDRLKRGVQEWSMLRAEAVLGAARLEAGRLGERGKAIARCRAAVAASPRAGGPFKELQQAWEEVASGKRVLGPEERRSDFERNSMTEKVLAELAPMLEAEGEILPALDARARRMLSEAMRSPMGVHHDVGPMARLLQKLPAGAPLPPTPMLVVLTPEAPTFRVDPWSPDGHSKARHRSRSGDANFWTFTFAAPPGQELATIHVKQRVTLGGGYLDLGYHYEGGTMSMLLYHRADPFTGDAEEERTFDVEPGQVVVHLHLAQGIDSRSVIKQVEATATFRAVK